MGDRKEQSAIGQLGMQAAGQVTGGIIGLATGGIENKRQRKQQQKLQDMQIRGMKEMGHFNNQMQMKLWNDTNYGAQMEHIRKAGLNPALMYGMSGGGGATAAAAGGSGVSGATAQGAGSGQMMQGMGMMMEMQLLKAQKENIEADTELKRTTATKTSGVDTDLTKATAENMVLNQIVTKYTGKELKSEYEQVNEPNREIKNTMVSAELSARQGIAETLVEQWAAGQLTNKSNAEIENIILKNNKTGVETRQIIKAMDLMEENIKGAKLDNIIKDLEARLQTETGIDKSSAGWLKILGRLFIQLMGSGVSKIQ